MKLTSNKILDTVIHRILDTDLGRAVPTLYRHHHPNNPIGEFLVVNTLSNTFGDGQVATVNVNIYVPDITPTINQGVQRYPNDSRLEELTLLAYQGLACYPIDERWFFDVEDERSISEEAISYTFSNVKLKLKHKHY